MDRPRKRKGGRIFAREQHCHQVGKDRRVSKRLALVIPRQYHRLKDVGWLYLGIRGRSQSVPCFRQQIIEPDEKFGKCAIKFSVTGHFQEPPDREGSEQTTV